MTFSAVSEAGRGISGGVGQREVSKTILHLVFLANLDQSIGDALLHNRAGLIDELPLPAHQTTATTSLDLLGKHFGEDMDRVPDVDGLEETPFPNPYERRRLHPRAMAAQARDQRETE